MTNTRVSRAGFFGHLRVKVLEIVSTAVSQARVRGDGLHRLSVKPHVYFRIIDIRGVLVRIRDGIYVPIDDVPVDYDGHAVGGKILSGVRVAVLIYRQWFA